jgi:ABC-type antimicrobial peptide transport system permease subunit
VALRGLMKNPLNSFINIFGLSVGIGLCIFAYAFARWTYSTDQFHEHKNSVYMVTFFADREGTLQQYGLTPRPLGEMLKADFTHIEKVCRIEDRSVVIKYGDHVFHERIRYVDPEFLDMFTFPLKWGTSNSLADVNSIILSETMSIKYFGDENPIGREILVKFDHDRSKAFKVTGVAKEFPKARTISFNFLINFQNLRTSQPDYDFDDWKAFINATLIQVQNPSDVRLIEKGMVRYKKLQNEAVQEDWAISSFSFEPLATLHERSEDIRDDISRSSKDNYTSVIYMAIISAFLLGLACFNYINIAIVSATKRLKEIGVRKSVGATRSVVIIQFLSENLVITFFALILGLTLGMTFFIPSFEQLFSFSMDFRLNDGVLWIYLPAILLFTCIASGIYPSLYISKFHVTGILKGSVKFGTRNTITKILLGFQLIMACIFISSSVYFTQNSDYLAKRSWGYNQAETLYARVPDLAAYERLHALMSQEPDVLSVSGSTHHLGKNHTTTVLHFPDREYEADQLSVDARYFQTMGLELKHGRVFKDYEGSDGQAVVVNELLAQTMGLENPIGKLFRMDSIQYEVIGVVKDFHSYNFFNPLRPTLFTVAAGADYRFLSMKVRSGAEMKIYKSLQASWAELFPEIPFEGGHQQDVWGFYFEEINIHGLVWRVFAIIAVSLASLGLYGLMTLNVAGRIREFSIRKVLGAGAKDIAANITREYTALFVLAIVLGAPLSYLLTKLLIEFSYKYHMPITYSGVAPAVVIMILILVVPVSTQIRKVLRSNPVEGLKME